MTEDCKRFTTSLMELAYGELPEQEAEDLRMHAAGCAACREELESILLTRKLAGQLSMMELGDELDSAVLGAAAESAAELDSGEDGGVVSLAAARKPRVQDSPGALERLKKVALTPALATAAAAAVVFAVTFFLAEKGAPTVSEPSFESVVATSAEGEEAPEEVADERAEEAFQVALAKQENLAANRDRPAAAEPRPSSDTRSRLATKGPTTSKPGDTPGFAAATADESRRRAARQSNRGGLGREGLQEIDLEGAPVPNGAEELARPARKEAPAPAVAPSSRKISLDSDGDDYRAGMDAFARGDCDEATEALRRVVSNHRADSSSRSGALHHLARCEKRRGRFGQALPWYDELLRGYPSYSARPEALWEAAACHRRLGHTGQARLRLEELRRFPAWKDRAEQEMGRLKD